MDNNFFENIKLLLDESEDSSADLESIGNYSNDELKQDLSTFDSEKLCQIVVAYRYLNFNEELAISAMTELGKRRVAGENFEFESFIEKNLDSLPKFNSNIPDFGSLIGKFTGKK